MSLKVATPAAGASALRARRFHFREIYRAFTSKQLKRLRRTNQRRRQSAIDRLINWFLGRDNMHSELPAAPEIANQSKVKLVLIGDGSRMNGIKGTKSSVPWAEVRRRFAQRGRNEGFMAVLNNEHCTSIKSACCGVRNAMAYKNKDINHRLPRKDGRTYRPLQYSLLICPRCGKPLQRNGAAATNQAHVGTYTLNGWGTAPWLRHGRNEQHQHTRRDGSAAPAAQLSPDLAGERPPTGGSVPDLPRGRQPPAHGRG
jgi:transposase